MKTARAPFCLFFALFTELVADPLACQGSIRKFDPLLTEGTLVSPGFDRSQPYPDNSQCDWVIPLNVDHAIVVAFESFDLGQSAACDDDSIALAVSDVRKDTKLVKLLCGQNIPRPFYFPAGMEVKMSFRSDFIGINYGFKARWHYTDDPPCPAGQVLCRNRKCVMESVTCNGVDDCGDASDETLYCDSVTMPMEETTDCGRPTIQPRLDHLFKVVGGQSAVRASWPWMVSIQMDVIEPSGHICGGALISSQHVISAAHCITHVRNKRFMRLAFGKHSYYDEDRNEVVRYVQDYKVFNSSSDDYTNDSQIPFDLNADILILKLSAPVPFGEYIQPICMPDPGDHLDPGTVCYSAGWGQTRGTGNHALKQIRQVIAPDCPQGVHAPPFNDETMLCSQPAGHGHQLCSGDSGGPLMCDRDGKWTLAGVVSHSLETNYHENICGNGIDNTVYVKTAHFRNWIDEVIESFDRM
ncbi:Chymotrypsinogen B [Halotydeus destructor]|nr:Chymotrypsinogen B [Halotydeus destructor]